MEVVAACALAAPVVVAARGWAVHKYKSRSFKDKNPEKLPTTLDGEKSPARPASPQRVWVELEAPEGEHRIALHGQVYDITKFAAHHPGGKIILAYSGKDASDVFELFHPPHVAKRLTAMHVGELSARPDEVAASALSLEYRALRRELWREGRFAPSPSFFACQQLLALMLVGVSILLLLAWPDSVLVQVLLAPCFLGLGLKQAAFLGHDTMHNGVLAKRGQTRWRQLLGQFNAGTLFGISTSMWLDEHNAHHAYTMRPHADPQFTYFPMWLQSTKEIGKWRSHLAALPPRQRALVWALTKALVRIQHLTWLPLSIVVGRVNLCLISFGYAATRGLWVDCVSMGLHVLWYAAYVKLLLPPTLSSRFLFMLVHFSWTGVLHVQLLLSHLMMAQIDEREEGAVGFVKCQLMTTRNIRSQWWMRWFHGGLDMQIEHHLFPMLPRHQLHKVAPRVRALVEKHGMPYTQLGFFEAIGVCLGELHRMSTAIAYSSIA